MVTGREKTDMHPEMTEAADEAGVELLTLHTKEEIGDWMRRWYRKAGYKRLCLLLMNLKTII